MRQSSLVNTDSSGYIFTELSLLFKCQCRMERATDAMSDGHAQNDKKSCSKHDE